jgi:hypothetical protein
MRYITAGRGPTYLSEITSLIAQPGNFYPNSHAT